MHYENVGRDVLTGFRNENEGNASLLRTLRVQRVRIHALGQSFPACCKIQKDATFPSNQVKEDGEIGALGQSFSACCKIPKDATFPTNQAKEDVEIGVVLTRFSDEKVGDASRLHKAKSEPVLIHGQSFSAYSKIPQDAILPSKQIQEDTEIDHNSNEHVEQEVGSTKVYMAANDENSNNTYSCCLYDDLRNLLLDAHQSQPILTSSRKETDEAGLLKDKEYNKTERMPIQNWLKQKIGRLRPFPLPLELRFIAVVILATCVFLLAVATVILHLSCASGSGMTSKSNCRRAYNNDTYYIFGKLLCPHNQKRAGYAHIILCRGQSRVAVQRGTPSGSFKLELKGIKDITSEFQILVFHSCYVGLPDYEEVVAKINFRNPVVSKVGCMDVGTVDLDITDPHRSLPSRMCPYNTEHVIPNQGWIDIEGRITSALVFSIIIINWSTPAGLVYDNNAKTRFL